MSRAVIVEADGGSRGNPGPAAYGAVLRDADTGEVLATKAETLGIATNNVAEYSGLIAGVALANEFAPDAELEIRMDSKLVIEQMAGRWKIKHPDMKPLALTAQRALAGRPVVWTWVPREENKAADALLNAALDGKDTVPRKREVPPMLAAPAPDTSSDRHGWRSRFTSVPTTFVLVRHGVTEHTERKVFSGSGGTDPELTDTGRDQAKRAGEWIRALGGVDAVVSSPLRRTQETAGVIASALGLEVDLEPGFAEVAFGDWEGYTFGEINEQWAGDLQKWLDSTAIAPPRGEAIDSVRERVFEARDRLIEQHAEKTVVVVSHVTPIKLLVADALGAPITSIYRMELAPASVTTVQ
ncbi:MAG TPA: bifunctional RNase H/acid phosphatase, partial [Aeromicrobium sp.]|nr:bifunctional RNase H/acid phosphatase [Aeromicrobium sp.]